MKKVKKIILILICMFSLVNVFMAVVKPVSRLFLYDNFVGTYGGDLFAMNGVLNFRDHLTLTPKVPNTCNLQEADIITMGDSFFEANFGSPRVPDILEKDLPNKKIFKVPRDDMSVFSDSPLAYLESNNYKKGEKKYLVVEGVERYAIERSSNNLKSYSDTENERRKIEKKKNAIPFSNIQNAIPKENLNYFLYNSVFYSPINQVIKTIRYNLLDYIDVRTPIYSKDKSKLFYFEEINFAKRTKNNALVNGVANNIVNLQTQLREKYNLELIYVIPPNKYSIYGNTTDNPIHYDNFIPRLTSVLQKKGIKTFDLYSEYKAYSATHSDSLYIGSDTHFGTKAKEILVSKLLPFIKN